MSVEIGRFIARAIKRVNNPSYHDEVVEPSPEEVLVLMSTAVETVEKMVQEWSQIVFAREEFGRELGMALAQTEDKLRRITGEDSKGKGNKWLKQSNK